MVKILSESGRKLLKKLHIGLAFAAAVTMLGLGVTAGAETGAFTVTGGVEGMDYAYASGVLTIMTAQELTISTSGSTADRIVVDSSDGADIILDGVSISSSSAAVLVNSGSGEVTIALAEGSENSLVSGESSAGIQKENSALLTIAGSGSLTVQGGKFAAGIGGGDGKSASDIIISGGVIDVKGGEFAAGIGGGWGGGASNITISGGCVTADSPEGGAASIGGGYNGTASNIVITGGSVLAKDTSYTKVGSKIFTCYGIGNGLTKLSEQDYINGTAVTPVYSDDREVYLLVVENPQGLEVELDGVPFVPNQHPGTDVLYFYLTAEQHTIKIGGVETDYFYNSDSNAWTKPGNEFIITGDGLKHGTDFVYPADTGVLTILTDKAINIANATPDTATDNVIVVADGVSANITLSGVNISSSAAAAFSIADGSAGNVKLTLADGSENILVSTGAYAGLQKNGENGTLLISGNGNLKAQGGAAGIGGSGDKSCNITINDTTVTAIGGSGAGIGGDKDKAASEISIIDSVVIATGGTNSAGIGAGGSGEVSAVSVRNSVVTATGNGTAAGIGGAGTVSDIIIDGGSVNAVAGANAAGKIGGSDAVTPANMMSNYVYLLTVQNPEKQAVLIDGTDYDPDYHSADDTNLYLYLAADDYVVTVGSNDTPYYFDSSAKVFRSPELKVTGGRLGTDYSFDKGAVTILTDTAMTIENIDKTTSASDTIIIGEDVNADITFDGVDIDSVGASVTVEAGASLKLALAEDSDNALSGGISAEGDVSVSGTGELVSDIVSTAQVTVSGGSVTSDNITGSAVVITGGSVKASAITPAPTNGTAPVYLLKIANPNNKTLYLDNAAYLPTQHSESDSNVYAYLTGEVHSVKADKPLTYHFDSLTSEFYLPDLNVYGDNVVYGTDYTYSDGVVTILTSTPVTIENIDSSKSTDDRIVIASGVSADVTLNGVNISAGSAALMIADNSTGKVKITLAADSTNYLKSGTEHAAVQKNGISGSLEITGSGSLTANGGWSAAAIGGGKGSSTGNITISGGVINAVAGDYGAGIGGGKGGYANGITIKDCTVTAKGGDRGAGIGGGDALDGGSANGSNITITNATVTANGGKSSAGIGGGHWGIGYNITINSGAVKAKGGSDGAAAGIGGGYGNAGYGITINGGSVTAYGSGSGSAGIGGSSGYSIEINGGSVNTGSISCTPTNKDDDNVYLLTLANPNNKTILIDGAKFLPSQHGIDNDTNVYAYLTPETHIVKLGDEEAKTYIYDQYNKQFVVIGSDLEVTGGEYGLDYTYPIETGVLTILTDTAMTISNSADTDVTAHTILIDKDINANITLDGVNISASGTALAADGGNVTVVLADGSANTLSTTGAAAILAEGSGTFKITGIGALEASGTAAISAAAATVTLDNTIITADGGITASAIEIDGGSVKADTLSAAPTNGTDNVYLLVIANPDNKAISINGTAYAIKQHGIDGDTNVYAYLTGETQAVVVGDEETMYTFDDTADSFVLPDLLVTGSGVRYGTDYTYKDGVVTILTAKAVTIANNPDVSVTTDTILVSKDISADITLNGVNIEAASGSALMIADDSSGKVKITLADGSTNTLQSGENCAGLQKSGDASTGTLTIQGGTNGTGTLTASGGKYGAGIGGGNGGAGSNIIISGGKVTATGGASGGAGIGGGYAGEGLYIKISGGTVTVTGGKYGAGVGGGGNGAGSDITISGGSVKAVAGTEANAIGGGKYKDAVIPTDGNSNNVYLLIISNSNNEAVVIDEEEYEPKQHSNSDSNIYAYLSGASDHTVSVGTSETTYRYSAEKAKFLIVPTADMFEVTIPTDPAELTYDGTAKEASVTASDSAMTYEIKYYKDGSSEPVTDTSAAGDYTFAISVMGDDKYATEIVTDDDWKFTVTGAELDPPASVAFTVGYGYKAEDAVFDTNTGAMAVGSNIMTGTWTLEYDGNITTSGNTYTAVFVPDDTNYLSFTFTSAQVTVTAVDPVVKADPESPRVIPGKSVTFAFKAEHPKYPEFTEGLPTEIISISDGSITSGDTTYTVAEDAEIDSTINITISIAGVDGKYNASSAEAVITVAEKNHVDDLISVDTENVIYGSDPQPQGTFGGETDGETEWTYTFAKGDVDVNGDFGELSELYNEFGALDVGTYTVKARYEDAANIGYGVGTFRVTPKQLRVTFKGNVTKIYDGTLAVEGYTVSADDFVLSGLVGGAKRSIDTLGVTILYKDKNVGEDKELIIAIVNDDHVLTADGEEDGNYTVPDSIDFTGAEIERRPVTVTAAAKTKTFGDDDPVFTYEADNLAGSETLTGGLSREEGEDAGEYQITQGTLTNDNNANYDITFVSDVLTITKAAAPENVALEAKHGWGAYGEKALAVTGLPADMGDIVNVAADVADADDIMADTASFADGMVTYTLNKNTIDKIGASAEITLNVTTRNYEDFTVTVIITITAKEDQETPAIELTFSLDPDGTFTAIITAVEGAEYKFGNGEWTDVNYIKGVQPSTYLTAYIRMAETETHNASAVASVTELSPKSTVLDPEFIPAPGAFKNSMDVQLSCSTTGATILYTTDGTDPLTNGIEYTEPVIIDKTTTFKAIAVKDGMLDSNVITGKFTKQSGGSGGSSENNGGGSGSGDDIGGTMPAYGESPAINGVNHNWYQIAEIVRALPIGGELEVQLNGCVDVPDFVIKAIAERDAHLTFEYNSLNHWYVDGKELSDTEELKNAHLNITYPVRIMSYELRGKAKFKFRISDTNQPTKLISDLDIKNAGEFANVYKLQDDALVYVDTVRIGKDGLAVFELSEKGDYVFMACKYSDLLGDVNNDGVVNALDAGALLRHIVELEEAPNIEVGDFNYSDSINAMDAGDILKWIVGAA